MTKTLVQHQNVVNSQEDIFSVAYNNKNLQLPKWPEATRGCPHAILRSALFGVGRKVKDREVLWNKEILASTGISMVYSGEQLDQSDLDLWLEILDKARAHKLGEKITFSARSMVRSLGHDKVGGKDIERLKKNIQRLNRANLTFKSTHGGQLSGRNMVESYDITQTGEISISLNPDIENMFSQSSYWKIIELKHRRMLKSQLALWLHGFYLTHTNPFNYKLSTIQALAGSEADPYEFKRMIKSAIKELAEIGWNMEIKEHLLYVTHPAFQYERPTAPVLENKAADDLQPAKSRPFKTNMDKVTMARMQRARVAL